MPSIHACAICFNGSCICRKCRKINRLSNDCMCAFSEEEQDTCFSIGKQFNVFNDDILMPRGYEHVMTA